MKVLKVHIKLHWGFSVRKPFFSASQPSFKVPPPTTLIGALSRALAYSKKMPEVLVISSGKKTYYSSTIKLLKYCKWASLALVDENLLPREGLVETHDIMRAVIAPYVRRENIPRGMLYAPQAHGRIYSPDLDILVTYFVEDPYAEQLQKIAWGITALGCKESIASTVDIKVLNLKEYKENIVKTRFYFEKDLAEDVKGDYIEDYLTLPSEEHFELASTKYTLTTFIIPLSVVLARINPDKALALSDGQDIYIVNKEVFS